MNIEWEANKIGSGGTLGPSLKTAPGKIGCPPDQYRDLDGTCREEMILTPKSTGKWEGMGFLAKDWMSLPLSDEVGLLKDLPSAPRSAPLEPEAITEIDLGTLLEVYWVDAESSHGWTSLDEINTEPVPVISVGWMVSRTERGITLASTTGSDLDHIEDLNGTIVLPIGTLTGFRILD